MSLDPYTAALIDAKARKLHWMRVAQLLRMGFDLARRDDLRSGRFIDDAVQATGYSENLLYRFLSVLKFVEQEIVGAGVATLQQLSDVPFASLELVKRAWMADRAAGENLLRLTLAGGLTVRELYSRVSECLDASHLPRDDRRASRRFRSTTESRVLELIRSRHSEKLCGEKNFRFLTLSQPILPFATSDATIVIERDGKIEAVDGVAIMVHFRSGANVKERIARWAVSSTYFRRFWIVIVDSPRFVSNVEAAVNHLVLSNVGVVGVRLPTMSLRIIRSPSGAPTPDRRSLLVDSLRNRLWEDAEPLVRRRRVGPR
jgi:hypothetical protein